MCFVSSPIPSLLLMVQRNPQQAVWSHLVLLWCTMVTEVKKRCVQDSKNIDYAKQHHTPHCWLPAKVVYSANSTKRFSWLNRSTSILLMKNVQIIIIMVIFIIIIIRYIYIYVHCIIEYTLYQWKLSNIFAWHSKYIAP